MSKIPAIKTSPPPAGERVQGEPAQVKQVADAKPEAGSGKKGWVRELTRAHNLGLPAAFMGAATTANFAQLASGDITRYMMRYTLDTAAPMLPRGVGAAASKAIGTMGASNFLSLEEAKPAVLKALQASKNIGVASDAKALVQVAVDGAKDAAPRMLSAAGKVGSKLVPGLNVGAAVLAAGQLYHVETDPKSTDLEKWLARSSLGLATTAAGASTLAGTAFAGSAILPLAPVTLPTAATAEVVSLGAGVLGVAADAVLMASRWTRSSRGE